MNLRQLEIFNAVMMTGTTSAAAEYLRVSQPAVSNMIKHIESTLDIELFERKNGRLAPTEEASLLFNEVKPLFSFYRAVDDKIRDIREKRTGSLRIASTLSPATALVPLAIQRFSARYPGIQITFDVQRVEDVINQVLHNVADIGVTLTIPENPSIISTPIHKGELICIVPKGHELASLDTISPTDLSDHPFIMMTRGTPLGNAIENAFNIAGEPLDWVVETPFFSNACGLVNAGVGCALVDEHGARSGSYSNIEIKSFTPTIPVSLFAVRSDERSASRLSKDFMNALEASINEQFGAP
jgi:DNA-binding transcriptional LysR family regulator